MTETLDSNPAPRFDMQRDGRVLKFRALGDWTIQTIGEIDQKMSDAVNTLDHDSVEYDFSSIGRLDTSGAYILSRALRCETGRELQWAISGGGQGKQILMREAASARMGRLPVERRAWYDILVRMGKATERFWFELYDTLAFLGKFVSVLGRLLLNPTKIRWKSVVALTEEVGLNAAPIVMLLSFFIGAVIAYMGANLLASFGAQVFMVELVGFSVLREFAVLITAIMLAGRSDSAFTAQIGAMKMRQEIDAMTVIGLDRYETLVIPRALACLISAPVLTFLAMLSGIFGGMLVAWLGPTEITPVLFLSRLNDAVDIRHFWVGLVKAPFFALIIAVVGCRQGLAVTGSVESLGARTTSSVVQAIFAVITMDAVFAMIFLEMGV